ncbi:MAG: alpha/beta fold hydrolase [Actinobacteria bacterium]|nr:MAG: alpha/beta fold hydrolase [Actinomycetota bacterium]
MPVKEGFIPFAGYRTWYRVVGEGEVAGKLPLLCLHGGPGATWHHMEPYEALAEGRRVVFYDQLGCGNSAVTEPHETSMWTPGLYVREVDAVREALGLDWGGMLGMQYAIGQPDGLASLIVESSPASVPDWMKEVNRLRDELPPEVQATLVKHEDAGTTDSPEYEEAMMVFYRRHVCRTDPWPDFVNRTFEGLLANPEVYYTMNGPSEFHVIGVIKDWDISQGLAKIQVPTLLFSGRYDEVTPATMELVHRGIPGSELMVFEESSHMSQAEEPEAVLDLVRRFLARVESGPRTAEARP